MADKATLNKLLEANNYVISRKQLSEKNYSGQQIKKYLKDNIFENCNFKLNTFEN